MATQRSIVDVLLLRRLLLLCVATTLCAQMADKDHPPQALYPSPSSKHNACDSIGHDHSGEQLVASAIPRPHKKSRYIMNKRLAAARAHGPGRVKTRGLSPIYNIIITIGHRETVGPRVAGEKHILVAPGSCAEPPSHSQIRLAEK